MCISILSTAHPDYPLILLSNRDEFLNRPTARAHWWEAPNNHVLGGRDLERREKGTWLGITRDGRIAVLTNFREEGQEVAKDKSRGGIVTAYLASQPDDSESNEDFARRMIEGVGINDVGGFSLIYGRLQPRKDGSSSGLSILSNRTSSAEGLVRIASKPGETHGLSNSHFGDLTWPKVVHGEQLLRQAINASITRHDPQDKFITNLFDVLSVDTLPKKKAGEDWNTYTRQLRNSILIPPVGGEAVESKTSDHVAAARGTDTPEPENVKVGESVYGTQKQTVILVGKDGKVVFTERTLGAKPGEERFEFDVEGWPA